MKEYTLDKIRQRLGLEKGDKSKDEEIQAMSPAFKVQLITAWELGDQTLANQMASWMRECGATPQDFT